MEYTEILRLKAMLEKEKIPFEYIDKSLDLLIAEKSYEIIIFSKDFESELCDAVQDFASYGSKKDLIEIRGGLTEEEQKNDSVLGWLSAEEVFKRFKYCYEHDTDTYDKGE